MLLLRRTGQIQTTLLYEAIENRYEKFEKDNEFYIRTDFFVCHVCRMR